MHTLTWPPAGWHHPTRAALPTGHHLRPVRATDVDLHLQAVLGSQERLWSLYGPLWGWPPADLTVELDREDLTRAEEETARGLSYSYALFDPGETELLGRLTVQPASTRDGLSGGGLSGGGPSGGERRGADDVSWWVVDWLVGGPIEAALKSFVPAWIESVWCLPRPRYNQTARRRLP